jgi:hypothetical protein
MKKFPIAAFFLLLWALPAEAQHYLPGMRGVEVIGGAVENFDGYYLHAGYSYYTKRKNRWTFSGEYLQHNYETEVGAIPLMQLTMESSYYKLLLSDLSKTFFAAAGISVLTGYETINMNEKLLPNGAIITNADHLVYGAAAAVEIEYYLDDRYIFLATVKQRICGGSSVGIFHTLFGVGIKYILE